MAGRPMKFDRDEAVKTALEVIWRDGYRASSVKALSDRLGITRSSFYNTFGSQDALLKEVLDVYVQRIPEAQLFAMTKDEPLAPTLTRVVREACKIRGGDPERRGCLAANAVAEILPAADAAGELVREISCATQDHIEQLVMWAQERGEVAQTVDAKGVALAIHGMIMGLNLQSKFVSGPDELWRSARASLEGLGLFSDSA